MRPRLGPPSEYLGGFVRVLENKTNTSVRASQATPGGGTKVGRPGLDEGDQVGQGRAGACSPETRGDSR